MPRNGFRLVAGVDEIRVFRPAGGAAKAFCRACGSSLFGGSWPEGDEVLVRFGSLDGDPGIRPSFRAHVDSAAPWDAIPVDGLTRFGEANPDLPGRPDRHPPDR